MNHFLKIFLALALAAVFLSVPASASKSFYFDVTTPNGSIGACRGAGCLVPLAPYTSEILSWNFVHNRIDYLYDGVKIDIYGDRVYDYPSFYYYPLYYRSYRNYFYSAPQEIFPPASVRNTQAASEQEKRNSDFTIQVNKNTARTKGTQSSTVQNSVLSFSPEESLIENTSTAQASVGSNTIVFEPEELEINCADIGFEFDSLDIESGQSTSKELRLKNTTSEDFFVESVSVEENAPEFGASASVLDGVIPENYSGRVKVNLNGFNFEDDAVRTAIVNARGHFESGKECIVSKEFSVGFHGTGREITTSASYEFNAPAVIENNGTGFSDVSLDNHSNEEIRVTITSSKNATVNPATIKVPAKSSIERVFSINGAQDGELIYYNISTNFRTLEERYSKIVFPKEPVEPVFVEPTGDNGSVVLLGFSSGVMFVNGKADVPFVLENTSFEEKEVRVKLSNPPKGFSFNEVVLIVPALQQVSFNIEVDDRGIEEFPAKAIISFEWNGKTINREVVFEKKESEIVIGLQNQPVENSGNGFFSTGLFALGANAVVFGMVLVFLAVVLFLVLKALQSDSNPHNETWVSSKVN